MKSEIILCCVSLVLGTVIGFFGGFKVGIDWYLPVPKTATTTYTISTTTYSADVGTDENGKLKLSNEKPLPEISLLKEKKDCEAKGGKFGVNALRQIDINNGHSSDEYLVVSKITCTAPDLFDYTITE